MRSSSSDTRGPTSAATDAGSGDEVDLEALRRDVRAWLSAHWVDGVDRHDFLDAVVEAGYATPAGSASAAGSA